MKKPSPVEKVPRNEADEEIAIFAMLISSTSSVTFGDSFLSEGASACANMVLWTLWSRP